MMQTVAIAGKEGGQPLYFTVERVEEALATYLHADRLDDAVDLYTRCDQDLGALLLQRGQDDLEFTQKLSDLFFRAHDFLRAALCCRSLNQPKKAALLFERAHKYREAAKNWQAAGEQISAAQALSRAGAHREAATLYLREGAPLRAALESLAGEHYFDAALTFANAGESSRALHAWQKATALVPEEGASVEAPPPALEVAEALVANGDHPAAATVLQSQVTRHPPSAQSLPIYLRLAELLVELEQGKRAKGLLRSVAEVLPDDPRVVAVTAGLDPFDEAVNDELPGKAPSQTSMLRPLPFFDVLFESDFFAAFDLAGLRTVYDACEVSEHQAGTVIVLRGTPRVGFWMVAAGQARWRPAEGVEMPERVLERGQHAFALNLARREDADGDLIARNNLTTLHLSEPAFVALTSTPNAVALQLTRALLRQAAQRPSDALNQDGALGGSSI